MDNLNELLLMQIAFECWRKTRLEQ